MQGSKSYGEVLGVCGDVGVWGIQTFQPWVGGKDSGTGGSDHPSPGWEGKLGLGGLEQRSSGLGGHWDLGGQLGHLTLSFHVLGWGDTGI